MSHSLLRPLCVLAMLPVTWEDALSLSLTRQPPAPHNIPSPFLVTPLPPPPPSVLGRDHAPGKACVQQDLSLCSELLFLLLPVKLIVLPSVQPSGLPS